MAHSNITPSRSELMKTTYSEKLVWCSLTKIKINEIEQIHLHSVVRLGKSLSLLWSGLGFVLGIWGLWDIFVLHYYILQTAILGEFSCVFFSSSCTEQHLPRQQWRQCRRAWVQGSPSSSSFSHWLAMLLPSTELEMAGRTLLLPSEGKETQKRKITEQMFRARL